MPLAIDLFAGLGGWSTGLLAEGWDCCGFDIEQHVYGADKYPGLLAIQDVRTLHGSQFAKASLIVASPPCQQYSYRAMPFSRGRNLPPPDNTLFEACFRIQREASEAAGRHIPLVVENVRGAQKWVGKARSRFGSYYLWGDIPAILPPFTVPAKVPGQDWNNFKDQGVISPHWRLARHEREGIKGVGPSWEDVKNKKTQSHWTNPAERDTRHATLGIKQSGGWFHNATSISRTTSSKSKARKEASAQIAKIPFLLAQFVARYYKPGTDYRIGFFF